MITTPRFFWLICASVALLGGCASQARQESQLVRVDLTAVGQNIGNIGYVTLISRQETTDFSFFVSGTSGYLRPVRLYAFVYPGPCSNRGPKPLYGMNDNVVTRRVATGWSFNREAKVPLNTLRAAHYSVVVANGATEGNAEQFCGDIP
ncbi:hypothetical protein [Pseudomonas sp. NA-150]|uniref:hypothetical protein n=1 Tax=Pseudomonas sp. NA-150 TaxID=3367525 RepID=UPI0037CC533E